MEGIKENSNDRQKELNQPKSAISNSRDSLLFGDLSGFERQLSPKLGSAQRSESIPRKSAPAETTTPKDDPAPVPPAAGLAAENQTGTERPSAVEQERQATVVNDSCAAVPNVANHARGGRTAAILASFTRTCRRHDIDPQVYLTQLLVNLPAARMADLPAWLPDSWKLALKARLDSPQSHTPQAS